MLAALLGLGWVVAGAVAIVFLTEDPEATGGPPRPVTPSAEPAPPALEPGFEPPVTRGETQVVETDGRLAIGITEPNPSFVRPPADGVAAEPFGRWQASFARLRPAAYRLVLDWPSLQPAAGAPASLEVPNAGCLRVLPPCGSWSGVREQLQAIAQRQKRTQMQVLVVITGSPDWAARPAGGCERAGIMPRSRPPRPEALPGYGRLVTDVLAAAQREGASLRYWSAWNEPNHPYFVSPQRERCSGSAPSAAVERYVELTRTMKAALDEAPGEQEYVLGELAGLIRRKSGSTGVREFARGMPDDLVCGARAWSQHGYVGGPDPVEEVVAGLDGRGCDQAPEIWMTETGVGGAKRGRSRRAGASSERAACLAMHRRLKRWYEDPRVTAAYQYTLREDDRFPTGLVSTALDRAYPVLGAWQAWGGSRAPEAPPPTAKQACGY